MDTNKNVIPHQLLRISIPCHRRICFAS